MTEWQPIETAPQDARFLAVAAGSTERIAWDDPAAVVTVRAPEGAIMCFSFQDENGIGFADEFGEVYGSDGRVSDADDITVEDDILRLTHWMPLPSPPEVLE